MIYTRFKNLFAIKGYGLFVICILLVGVGISVTQPYLSLYATEDLGMSAGSFGVFIAVSSLSGVAVNSLIAKRSDSGLDRKWLIIFAMLSSALGYASYLVFDNFLILLIVVTIFMDSGLLLCRKSTLMHRSRQSRVIRMTGLLRCLRCVRWYRWAS